MSGDGYTRLYATATGLLLVAAGLFGFLVGSEFGEASLTGSLIGIYAVNGWANTLHVLTGLLALGLASRSSRAWTWIGAVLFTGLGLWGILAPDGTLLAGILPAPRTVNTVNLLIGLSGFAALIAGPIRNRAGRKETRKRARRVRSRTASPAPGAGKPETEGSASARPGN